MINKTIFRECCEEEGFNEQELYGAYKLFFGTLFSEPRLRIINVLKKKRLNVSEIMEKLNLDQTTISHNLSRLKHHGFVNSQIEGKFRYYSLNEETIKPLMNIIEKHMSQFCIHILRKMKGEKKNGKKK